MPPADIDYPLRHRSRGLPRLDFLKQSLCNLCTIGAHLRRFWVGSLAQLAQSVKALSVDKALLVLRFQLEPCTVYTYTQNSIETYNRMV
jgi:hypothetical protein